MTRSVELTRRLLAVLERDWRQAEQLLLMVDAAAPLRRSLALRLVADDRWFAAAVAQWPGDRARQRRAVRHLLCDCAGTDPALPTIRAFVEDPVATPVLLALRETLRSRLRKTSGRALLTCANLLRASDPDGASLPNAIAALSSDPGLDASAARARVRARLGLSLVARVEDFRHPALLEQLESDDPDLCRQGDEVLAGLTAGLSSAARAEVAWVLLGDRQWRLAAKVAAPGRVEEVLSALVSGCIEAVLAHVARVAPPEVEQLRGLHEQLSGMDRCLAKRRGRQAMLSGSRADAPTRLGEFVGEVRRLIVSAATEPTEAAAGPLAELAARLLVFDRPEAVLSATLQAHRLQRQLLADALGLASTD